MITECGDKTYSKKSKRREVKRGEERGHPEGSYSACREGQYGVHYSSLLLIRISYCSPRHERWPMTEIGKIREEVRETVRTKVRTD